MNENKLEFPYQVKLYQRVQVSQCFKVQRMYKVQNKQSASCVSMFTKCSRFEQTALTHIWRPNSATTKSRHCLIRYLCVCMDMFNQGWFIFTNNKFGSVAIKVSKHWNSTFCIIQCAKRELFLETSYKFKVHLIYTILACAFQYLFYCLFRSAESAANWTGSNLIGLLKQFQKIILAAKPSKQSDD